MEHTRLGNTGVKVSRLCLGCMSFGSAKWRPWVLERDEAGRSSTLDRCGHNFLRPDVYSQGQSEVVTGHFLREYGKLDELVIATKVFFPMGSGPNRGGLSRKHIVQACEASLRRLGVEAIDLYQIHRLDHDTPMEEMLAALDQLVRQGKVHYIGASSMYGWQFMKALAHSDRRACSLRTMRTLNSSIARKREMVPLLIEKLDYPWARSRACMLAGTQKLATTRPRAATSASIKCSTSTSDWRGRSATSRRTRRRARTDRAGWLLHQPSSRTYHRAPKPTLDDASRRLAEAGSE